MPWRYVHLPMYSSHIFRTQGMAGKRPFGLHCTCSCPFFIFFFNVELDTLIARSLWVCQNAAASKLPLKTDASVS